MLWLGLTLLALAVVCFALSLRGRTTARGVFCRRCRFDLHGLDLTTPSPTCPECGCGLTAAKSRRTTLRRASRPGLVLGVILLLAGVGVIAVQLPNAGPRILGAMPDSVVVALTELGVDPALTEVTNRLTRTPPLSPGLFDRLIDDALAHQADAGAPWDPRWGDVLVTALLGGHMSDDEAMRYFDAGSVSSTVFRDEIVHGVGELHYELSLASSGRVSVNPSFAPRGYSGFTVSFENIRVTMDAPRIEAEPADASSLGLSIPGVGGYYRSYHQRTVPVQPGAWAGVASGPAVVVINFDAVLTRHADKHEFGRTPHRVEQGVTILPAGTDLIQLLDSVEAAAAAGASLSIPQLKVLQPLPTPRGASEPVASAPIEIRALPVAVSARVFVLDGQRETEIGKFRSVANPGGGASTMMSSISWTVPVGELAASGSLIDAWLARGVVDIILRPDPEHALSEPGIESIVGTPLIFRGVPVVAQSNPSQFYSSRAGLAGITATPLTESD